uniref:Natriuretic peptide C n=1 Tax=Seriola dumerili TaxID=41447 RepID=A0A3B4TRA3_SERDU
MAVRVTVSNQLPVDRNRQKTQRPCLWMVRMRQQRRTARWQHKGGQLIRREKTGDGESGSAASGPRREVCPAVSESLRSLLGEELAEFLESEERERRLDAVRSRIRLLRDLRMDTRARGMWARLLNDQPAPRKHKSGNKKGGSTSRSGCFGHKMDRIGTISGMGC